MPMDPMTFLLFLLESLDDDGAAKAAAAVEETPWPDQLTIVGFDGLVTMRGTAGPFKGSKAKYYLFAEEMFTVLKLERGYDRKGGLLCKPQGKCKISSWEGEYDLEDLFRMQNDLNISIVRLDPPQLLPAIVTIVAILQY